MGALNAHGRWPYGKVLGWGMLGFRCVDFSLTFVIIFLLHAVCCRISENCHLDFVACQRLLMWLKDKFWKNMQIRSKWVRCVFSRCSGNRLDTERWRALYRWRVCAFIILGLSGQDKKVISHPSHTAKWWSHAFSVFFVVVVIFQQ